MKGGTSVNETIIIEMSKNIVAKEEIAHYEKFLFFYHNVFKNRLLEMRCDVHAQV